MIRRGAEQGPNFAGGFTIVRWGCGSACVDWAIVDARSGRIVFPDAYRILVNVHGEGDRINFRADSRLVILIGMPHEKAEREGVHFLEWTGRDLRRIRFVPLKELCG